MGLFSYFSKKNATSKTKGLNKSQEFYNDLTKEFYSDIVNHSPSMTLYFTKEDGWIGANQTFFNTMNFSNIGEFRRQHESVRKLFLKESEEIFTEDDKSWLDYLKKYEVDGYPITISTPGSKILFVSARVYASRYNQEIYVLELQDIGEVQKAKSRGKEIEQIKAKFLANVGHEFRTPMNAILGFLDLLGKSALRDEQDEYLSMINDSSKNLMTNMETLLDLAQMQSGRLIVAPSSFDLLTKMENVALEATEKAAKKSVELFAFIDPKLPAFLSGDEKKIGQIVSSLLRNAINFTPNGGKITLEVKLVKRNQNGECAISFSVKDDGAAIAQDRLAFMSEPFAAGDQAEERLGIELSLSHGLVELLGSKLRIQSERGEGGHFAFVLNFKESQSQSYETLAKKKAKVLLLDATRMDRANLLATYLRSFAIDVVKSNVLDENVYEGVQALYVIANNDDDSWIAQLEAYSKDAHVVLSLDAKEKSREKSIPFVDEVLREPLLPSSISKHLDSLYGLSAEEEKEKEKEEEEKRETRKPQVRGKATALVVEDNLINQRLISLILKEYDIVASTASNGAQAVQMCDKYKYDIVFMDIDMPKKNGIVATNEIKEAIGLNGQTPIVALTAMAMDGDKETLLDAGLDDYLSKPLTREKLERILNTYLKTIG